MTEDKRIYVAVAGTIQVPAASYIHNNKSVPNYQKGLKTVVQPVGRQIAQACHVVSKLRILQFIQNLKETLRAVFEAVKDLDVKHALAEIGFAIESLKFNPETTIILQVRDSAEMQHVHFLLFKKKLNPIFFSDDNPEYGPGSWPTAVAVFATKKQVEGILDYLPLWGRDGQ